MMTSLMLFAAAIISVNSDTFIKTSRLFINEDKVSENFKGDFNTDNNHFTFLSHGSGYILIGARNMVYNLSVANLSIHRTIRWISTPNDVEMCLMKGKSEEECQNYIRVFVKQRNGNILTCGTNAYKPTCRQYSYYQDEYHLEKEFSGYAIVPYDPWTNFTSIYMPHTDELYTGSVSDFSGTDSLIYRKPLSGNSYELRTQRNDLKCLNDPNFIYSHEDDEHIYFWFREIAVEYANYEKIVVGRVGRVCKSDQGGSRSRLWTTFVKARLNCSLPGDILFYFNELQSISVLDSVVYAVFTTPRNDFRTSAICMFAMDDVRNVLNHGNFKIQTSSTSVWLPVMKHRLPTPRPGSCGKNSKTLSEDVVNFIQKNSLMHEVVPSYFNQPIFIHSNLRSQLTQLAVYKETALNGILYDILFVGTDDGRVLKLVNIQHNNQNPETVLIADIQVFASGSPVTGLNFAINETFADSIERKLLVISSNEIKAIPICHCSSKATCTSCVHLQDPCCVWNSEQKLCASNIIPNRTSNDYYIQNIVSGYSDECQSSDQEAESYAIHELYVQTDDIAKSTSVTYNAEYLAITVILTLIISSTVGFLSGYKIARWQIVENIYDRNSSSTVQNDLYAIKCSLVEPILDAKTNYEEKKNVLILNNLNIPQNFPSRRVYL